MRLALAALALVVASSAGAADVQRFGEWREAAPDWRRGYASALADFASSHDLTSDAEGHNNTLIVRKCLDGKTEAELMSFVDEYAASRLNATSSPAFEIVIDAFYIHCLSPMR